MSNRKQTKGVSCTATSKAAKPKAAAKAAHKDAVKIVGRAFAKTVKSAAAKNPKRRSIRLDDVDEATYQFYGEQAAKRGLSIGAIASAYLAKLAEKMRENMAAKAKR